MNSKQPQVTLFWFRRDLRLEDNAALYQALKNHENVLPLFIFDKTILKDLPVDDLRVLFIYRSIQKIKNELQKKGSDLHVVYGQPLEIFKKLVKQFQIGAVYANHDYEPAATKRDSEIQKFCEANQIQFLTSKDQCIFEKSEILTDQQKNYTVFTPYKKKWLTALSPFYLKPYQNEIYEKNYLKVKKASPLIALDEMNFIDQKFQFPDSQVSLQTLRNYGEERDFPELDATSRLGIHLRFGTVSPRLLASLGQKHSAVWLSELIWRDFFMQILWHFPHVEKLSFRPQFEKIAWRSESSEFRKWCVGLTGYPMVDAGMRQLNATGFMHNRVRMVVASFLTKHLLMHWYQGERYFAEKLLDYDLSANSGNWQWAAGTGCDAAPYFRIFNPTSQLQRFDPDLKYIKKWIPEYGTDKYIGPMVDHTFARDRALAEFKRALK